MFFRNAQRNGVTRRGMYYFKNYGLTMIVIKSKYMLYTNLILFEILSLFCTCVSARIAFTNADAGPDAR